MLQKRKIFIQLCHLNWNTDLLAESEDMDDTPELGLSCMIPVM